jgi:uncharacterized protein (TIGR03437 family)
VLKLSLIALAVCFAAPAQNFTYPAFLTPGYLVAGSTTRAINIFNQGYSQAENLTALWNGSPRTTIKMGLGGYTIQLTDADLAASQLAEIQMRDSASGALVDLTYCLIVLGVKPTGIAFDPTRNLAYLATPQQTADSRFPPNSVVAFDPASGKAGAVLTFGGVPGNLALSSDATVLYVVDESAGVVHRIDPASFLEAGKFSFRAATVIGSSFAPRDLITVMPGKPNTLALGFAPNLGGSGASVAIFDSGVPRSSAIAASCCQFSGTNVNSFLFSPDGQYFFQDGNTYYMSDPSSGGALPATLRYTIDSTGFGVNQKALAASGQGAADISGNLLYTFGVTAIDYTVMAPVRNLGISGPVAVDSNTQRLFVLYTPPFFDDGGDAYPVELAAYDLSTFEALGAQPVRLTAAPGLKSSEALIRFGTDGFMIPSSAGLLVFHTPLAGPAPNTSANAVVNAASQTGGPIAPGEIVTIYGTNLGPAAPQVAALGNTGLFASALSNVQVLFGSTAATPLLAYSGQLNVVAPFDLTPGQNVEMQVLYNGLPSAKISLPVAAAAPGLFTQNGSGAGRVSVVNIDGSVNTPSPAGAIATLYGTGGGLTGGAIDGAIAREPATLAASVQVSVAGRNAAVLYAGAAPGIVNGAFQINMSIPANIPSGLQPITVTIGGQTSPNGALLEIR